MASMCRPMARRPSRRCAITSWAKAALAVPKAAMAMPARIQGFMQVRLPLLRAARAAPSTLMLPYHARNSP